MTFLTGNLNSWCKNIGYFWILAPKVHDFFLFAPKYIEKYEKNEYFMRENSNFERFFATINFIFFSILWIFWHSVPFCIQKYLRLKLAGGPAPHLLSDQWWIDQCPTTERSKCNHNKHLFPIFPPFDSNLVTGVPIGLGNPMVFWFSRLRFQAIEDRISHSEWNWSGS